MLKLELTGKKCFLVKIFKLAAEMSLIFLVFYWKVMETGSRKNSNPKNYTGVKVNLYFIHEAKSRTKHKTLHKIMQLVKGKLYFQN